VSKSTEADVSKFSMICWNFVEAWSVFFQSQSGAIFVDFLFVENKMLCYDSEHVICISECIRQQITA